MAKDLTIPKLFMRDNIFCPGCGHGIIQKVLAEAMEELGVADNAILANAVGCTCNTAVYFGVDIIQAAHGRASATAQGIKAVRPDNFVFAYQGDGDAGAIGFSETMYAAKRNAPITVFFVNNGVFGMTGGQTAPTSLMDQKTVTAVDGVNYDNFGKPLHLAELISQFDVGYVARGSVANFKEITKLKEYIRKAIQCQIDGKGYSFVEILSPCPINWKMKPVDCMERLEQVSMEEFKCGELKGLGE